MNKLEKLKGVLQLKKIGFLIGYLVIGRALKEYNM
jgi:hypothetical protein